MREARRRPGPRGSGRWRRSALLAPLIAALALPLLAGPVSAAPKQGKPAKPVTTSYSNPLAPVIPGTDQTVDSCADPTVIKGQDGEAAPDGQQYWYMYCTTDPLNDEDRDAAGALVFNRIPTMRSTDLVNWTYLGNAFTEGPEWAADDAGLWAPDVVYSSATDRYYMFVTVTKTDPAVNGVAGCTDASAIGVATSPSPTGGLETPGDTSDDWVWSDTPAVFPRMNGQDVCNFFWTFDPDVLGDTVGTNSVIYYGSYYGGIFAAPITFTESGATTDAAAAEQVTIANRYEGANVVERDGYYYLFVSATNCCNGGLTGYSVFVGRSTSPYGPFVDREGVSLLAGRVGGTPFLTMNGNRWIGTGHNSVFEDEAGQWWTVYHAVDQEDPFFEGAPGFTKRPVLLDPIDWIDGWPTVRGGQWASDGTMPAPAAQDGQRSRYRTKLVKPQVVGQRIPGFSDEFSGTSLSDSWDWVREPDPALYQVGGGFLTWDTTATDLARGSDTAPVLTRAAPTGDYVVETRVRLDVPAEGCCFNFAQAGLVVYEDDDNYVKLVNASIFETRQTEFAKEESPVPAGQDSYGNTVVGPPGEWTYLRIVVERLSGEEQRVAGGDTERYTAYTSRDGITWVRGGVWTHTLGGARIGLVSMGYDGFEAEFDYVRVYSLKGGPRPRP